MSVFSSVYRSVYRTVHRAVAGGGSAAGWTLANLNPVLWLEADYGATTSGVASGNGDAVDSWLSRDAGAKAALQATAAKRFTLETNSINGHPAMLADGVDDFMSLSLDLSSTTGLSIYTVLKSGSAEDYSMAFEHTEEIGSNAGGFYLVPRGASTAGNASITGTAGGQTLIDSPVDLTDGASKLIELHSNLTNSHRLTVNGTAGTESTSALTGTLRNDTFYIGMRAGTSLPFAGRIALILICQTLNSDEDKALARALIAAKYGITLAS